MITREKVSVLIDLSSLLVNLIPEGAIFATTDLTKVTWKKASDIFDVSAIDVGMEIRRGGAPYAAIYEKRLATETLPRAVYGIRLFLTAVPVINDNDISGSFVVIQPRMHPVAKAFNDFAPIIAEMFPEGAFLYMSDLEKIGYRQESKKFDVPGMQLGTPLNPDMIASKAIKAKRLVVEELDASVHGVPMQVMASPLLSDEDSNQVVCTLGMALPKHNARQLKEASHHLSQELEGLSSVVLELAATAGQINSNEQELNELILNINKFSTDIDEVLGLITLIADETKMLGLNAAIEAAHAGQSGKGFGVVAAEIRKLSIESKNTVLKIKGFVENIKKSIEEATGKSTNTLRSCEDQAAATEEISASVQEIAGVADRLAHMAQAM
ncbi:MAG: methyl-accepting chemotaxis protein [Syntrophomonas sp.]